MRVKALLAVIAAAAGITALAQGPTYNLGRTPTAEESRTCCLPIAPDGTGLPPGSGTAQQGAPIFAQKCASCHVATGREGPWDVLVAEDITGHGHIARGVGTEMRVTLAVPLSD